MGKKTKQMPEGNEDNAGFESQIQQIVRNIEKPNLNETGNRKGSKPNNKINHVGDRI